MSRRGRVLSAALSGGISKRSKDNIFCTENAAYRFTVYRVKFHSLNFNHVKLTDVAEFIKYFFKCVIIIFPYNKKNIVGSGAGPF